MSPLSFEDWRQSIYVEIDPLIVVELQKLHNIDADKEIENVAHNEYELYVAMFDRENYNTETK